MSDFKIKYEYTSPFGEEWIIKKKHFGFLWFKYKEHTYYTLEKAEKAFDKISETQLRHKKLKRLQKS